MNKAYIEINDQNIITKSFTDGFETPNETSICIGDNDRCWHLQIKDMDNLYNYKYVNNEIVEIPDEEKHSSQDYLDLKKKALKNEIENMYLQEKTQTRKGITSKTLGVEIDCRELDYNQTKALADYMEYNNIASTPSYKVFDNSYITATVTQLREVLKEITNYQVELWVKKDNLKNLVNKASSMEEVQTIKW